MRDSDLIGKTVRAVFISPDKTVIRLECDGGPVHLETYGDCCSESWVEHVNGAESLIGCTISKIESKDLGEVIPTRQEHDQLYSTTITSDQPPDFKGYRWAKEFSIEYRNSSNGYYGGGLEIVSAPDERPAEFVELKDF